LKEILIEESLLNEMIEHALQGSPEEVCGIVGGNDDRAEEIFRMTNVEHSPVSYFMDSMEQFQVMKDLRKKNLKMVAIYHSHPEAGAYPSSKDVSLAFYDDAAYIIISLIHDKPVVRAFMIREGRVDEVRIVG